MAYVIITASLPLRQPSSVSNNNNGGIQPAVPQTVNVMITALFENYIASKHAAWVISHIRCFHITSQKHQSLLYPLSVCTAVFVFASAF